MTFNEAQLCTIWDRNPQLKQESVRLSEDKRKTRLARRRRATSRGRPRIALMSRRRPKRLRGDHCFACSDRTEIAMCNGY